jgi:ferredoxin-type protein NapH
MAVSNPEQNYFAFRFNIIKEGIAKWFKSLSQKRIRMMRLISQITFFILINGAFLGLARLPVPAPIHVPSGSPYTTVWGGFAAIQYVLSEGQFPFFALGIFFIVGGLVGKLFCGWICPVGFWQDILAWLPVKRLKVSKPDNVAWKDVSGILLWGSIIVAGFFGYNRLTADGRFQDTWITRMPFDAVDPAGVLFVTWFYILSWEIIPGNDGFFRGLLVLDTIVIVKTIIFILISFLAIKVPRAYCRWICPTGALLGYCSKYSALTVRRNPIKCVDGCQKCEDACPMGVPITDYGMDGIKDSLCISCGDCIDACSDAMSFGFRS